MKTLIRLGCIFGFFFAAVHLTVMIAPMTYLKLHNEIGFWPVSLSSSVDRARQKLEATPEPFCKEPTLLVWNSSFGRLATVPEGTMLPERHEFTELVLGNTGIIRQSTRAALTAMSEFNATILEMCF